MHLAIIGCGYIGRSLAVKWKKKNYLLTLTIQKSKEYESLLPLAQKVYLLKSFDEEELRPIVEQNDVLVLTLSADSINEYEATFFKTAETIYKLAKKTTTPKYLIYTSKTSLYGEQNGLWTDENALLKPLSEADRILSKTEKRLLQLKELNWKVCILRLAEIYGPGHELSQKNKKLSLEILETYQDTYTNMVHLEDVTGAIDYALNHKLEGIYNLADDEHPTLKEFLKQIYKELGIQSKTKWEATTKKPYLGNFRVSNYKIKSTGYRFIYPKRLIN
ncbi:MAG: NAD-dependent epimerase/dehydratase family protein [Parachlamydiales bacterium]|jgi:nucleoside-diphosphate-sugar epimerase